jgi:hypothetical protein
MVWTAAWRALTLSLLLIVMAGEAPVLHRHGCATPAFYDEACPLSQLFGSRGESARSDESIWRSRFP